MFMCVCNRVVVLSYDDVCSYMGRFRERTRLRFVQQQMRVLIFDEGP